MSGKNLVVFKLTRNEIDELLSLNNLTAEDIGNSYIIRDNSLEDVGCWQSGLRKSKTEVITIQYKFLFHYHGVLLNKLMSKNIEWTDNRAHFKSVNSFLRSKKLLKFQKKFESLDIWD